MSAVELAQFGINAVMGLGNLVLNEANVDASNRISAANAAASNLVRKANNQLGASRASLARFTQSVNNQRTLENTGQNYEAAAMNYRRARDSRTNDDFETQLAFAEQSGAQAAASAFSGLSGGVTDVVAGTTALRKSRIQQRTTEALKQGDYDAGKQAGKILQAGWDSLDYSEVADTMDYGINVATQQAKTGNLWTAVMGGQDMKAVANILGSAGSKFDAFADRAGPVGSGSDGRSRTITGGR